MPDEKLERPSRRRPRPRTQPHADDNDARPIKVAAPTESQEVVWTLALSKKAEIDNILEQRQRDGPPHLDNDDYNEADEEPGRYASYPPESVSRQPRMTEDELARAHSDVFGRPPPDIARVEKRLIALEGEAVRLPASESSALRMALRKHPLLFVNCPHTKLIVEQDEGDFDATEAARRLARYWECRRSMLGDEVCYAPGTFADPFRIDHLRFYERMQTILRDPNSNDMVRQDAMRLIEAIDDAKVKALDIILEEMKEDNVEFLGELTMAMNSPHDLKLQFLRVEDLVEERAAQRLVTYWDTGLRLFGPALRRRKVTLRDLANCSVLLSLGMFRLMPFEDDSGRSILVFRKICANEGQGDSSRHVSEERLLQMGIDEKHFARVTWYFLQTALERDVCRRNGLVVFFDMRGITRNRFAKGLLYRQALANVVNCMPVKIRVVHFVFQHSTSMWRKLLFKVMNNLSLKRRIVVHAGTTDELLNELSTHFGIRADNLPVDMGGNVDWEHFTHWLHDRRDAGL